MRAASWAGFVSLETRLIMSRAYKFFRSTFPFAVLFLPFHRPHILIVLVFILLCFSSQNVLSSEKLHSSNDTNNIYSNISLPESEKMGRYEGRRREEGGGDEEEREEGASLDNQENFLEDEVTQHKDDYENSSSSSSSSIDNIEKNRDNRSSLLLLLERTKDSTNNDRCRFNYCETNVEGNKRKETRGFPVTILNLVSDVNVSDENAEAANSESPFIGFESFQKFPVKITQKPPSGASVEKFDRRHFGPSKLEITRQPSNISTLDATEALPDLPMSPSRDVVPHRRKGNSREKNNVDHWENKEEKHQEVNGEDNFTLSFNDTLETFATEDIVNSKNAQVSTIASVPITTRKMSWLPNYHKNFEKDDHFNGNWSKNFQNQKVNVTILGLFELTQKNEPRPEGPSELQAAKLAIDKINQMELLPKFHLRLHHNDTQCDPGVAVDRFFHAIYSSNKNSLMPLLLGTACSEVSETLAKIVPYWNVVQVSFGSTTPALSDPTEFPLFIRTVAPDSSHNSARIALIKHFGWDTVSAFSQNGDMYALAVNDLVTELEQANITCTATITFAENDYKEQLRTLKDLDTRIIIGSFSPRLAPHVFCEAWKLGMHGGDYAWILPGDTIDLSGMTGDWWHIRPDNCSPSQLLQTLDGLIIVKSHGAILSDDISHSGLTSSEFTAELAKRGVTVSQYAAQTYDAVWAVAVAMNKSEAFLNKKNVSFSQYSHKRQDLAYYLLGQMKDLHFNGVSGPVSFDGADRVGITAFYQMQGHDQRRIAIFTPDDGQLIMNCPGCAITRWPGGHPPAARRVFRLRVVTVAPAAFLVVTCLSSVGVTLALAFLAFNLHFRKHKSIKLSSPRLNNMAAVGCGLVYGAVVLLGLDHATLPDSDDYFPVVCTARVYLLSAGFSLAFGSMFTKTYRVHRIFTRSRSGVVKKKLLQDTQLISLICVLLLIDGLVVTLWVTMDPMQRHLRNLTLEINPQERGVVYQPQVEVCRSQHTNGWLGALYVYKGLLLVVGVYMAWETRELQYRVEVQNRVYRREMAQLELELARLEKQLGQENVDPSQGSSNASIPQRNPSISGGLPLLLLSVLPPVIPRASWPSADPSGMRRGTVAFSSQPDLPDGGPRRSLVDIYKLHQRRETEGPTRLGVFQRLISLFGSRPSSRKASTASFTGVASALRVHMGYIAGLVPGTKAASTYQVDAQGTRSHLRCGSGPIISITSEEDRRLSLGLRRKESSEPRVNFILPSHSSANNSSSSREKIRGSPRFPHRIVPANSLGTISSFSTIGISRPHRWHSMEDAWKPKFTGTPRGSCHQNSDVWATQEVGIPLSELGNTFRGRRPPDYQSLNLTIPADSDVSPDDVRLGSDLRKLFQEKDDVSELSSPIDLEQRNNLTIITSPTALRISNVIAELSRTNGSIVTVTSSSSSSSCCCSSSAQENGLGVSNEECTVSQSSRQILRTNLDSQIYETVDLSSSFDDHGPTAV
ncbi:uncharacterized protein LOC127276638 isoform X2 [Leptopilina boulardi]|uniref:uncharacterized protein LOC127276638 isoform X2 n=1 Tax=Leptopilina boulardi TaxID=63433 RepID=UPI0021F60A84|nr:uncharacterized protein LOC127276638 isoform X2 [Leptopilina boulardi]